MTLALSVRNPWASFIVRQEPGAKDIENRIWPTRLRGRIAIHASKAIERKLYGQRGDLDVAALAEAERLAGHILGTVNLTGCHLAGSMECNNAGCRENPWAQWSDAPLWHWELENPRKFVTPFPARGALKLWEPDPSVAYLIKTGETE